MRVDGSSSGEDRYCYSGGCGVDIREKKINEDRKTLHSNTKCK